MVRLLNPGFHLCLTPPGANLGPPLRGSSQIVRLGGQIVIGNEAIPTGTGTVEFVPLRASLHPGLISGHHSVVRHRSYALESFGLSHRKCCPDLRFSSACEDSRFRIRWALFVPHSTRIELPWRLPSNQIERELHRRLHRRWLHQATDVSRSAWIRPPTNRNKPCGTMRIRSAAQP